MRAMPSGLFPRAAAAAFVAQFVALDLAIPGPAAAVENPRLLLGTLASGLFWLFCVSVCRGHAGRAAIAFLAALDLVIRALFFRYYHARIDLQVLLSAHHSWADVRPVLVRALPAMATSVCGVAILQFAVLSASRGAVRASWPFAAAAGLPTLAVITSDSMLAAARQDTPRAISVTTKASIPPLEPAREIMPNVLVLLTESVRASDYCSGRDPSCRTAPQVDALLPDRFPLREMRAVSSYTAPSISAILTGRPPIGSEEHLQATPGLFDFLHATHIGNRSPTVVYWSAQTGSLFEGRDVRRTVDSFVTVDTLVGHPVNDLEEVIEKGVDRLLASHVAREMPKLPKPFLAVLHFQGTHAPYFVDEAHAPFRPFSHVVAWSGLEELHNAYLDAIIEQDRSVAACIRSFLAAVGASPYVIVFTSDHGEAFGEHAAIHHGQNLYEEQVHVPAWVAVGGGALDSAQIAALASYEHAFVTHLDLLPTLLAAAGLLNDPRMEPFRLSFAGRSLVSARRPLPGPVPVTNCTAMFPCPLNTWGMLGERQELLAQAWDGGWRCLEHGGRALPPEDPACLSLRRASQAYFARQPNGASNL